MRQSSLWWIGRDKPYVLPVEHYPKEKKTSGYLAALAILKQREHKGESNGY